MLLASYNEIQIYMSLQNIYRVKICNDRPTAHVHHVAVEVQAHTHNVALGQPVWQSSLYAHGGGEPEGAVDGNRANNWRDMSCSCTAAYSAWPWWAVDLGKPYYIHTVVLVNRADCCGECTASTELLIELTSIHTI